VVIAAVEKVLATWDPNKERTHEDACETCDFIADIRAALDTARNTSHHQEGR
jgi:hypothetical protein